MIEAIKRRRSTRIFTPISIPNEDVLEIIHAGMCAPCTKGIRSWEFLVVTDAAKKKELGERIPFAQMVGDSSVAIIVFGNSDVEFIEENIVVNCSAAIENMLIQATEMNYGNIWIGLFPIKARMETITTIFTAPEHLVPVGMVLLGGCGESFEPIDRFDSTVIYYDSFS